MVAILLVAPWYQVITSQQITNTFTQTFTATTGFTFQVASTSQEAQTVYTLPNSITVQGTPNGVNCVAAPSASTCGLWASTPFTLEAGSSILVNCECHGVIGIYATTSPYTSVDFTLNGNPSSNPSGGTVPVTGLYEVGILNLQTYPVTETGITVIEQTPVIASLAETSYYTANNTEFNTVETSVPSISQVAPYSIVGILPSAILILVLCLIVMFMVLVERGIISISIRQRRKRRKSVRRRR